MIEQNNYTNQFLHVIGKQLNRVEERVENKVILQPGNQVKPNPTLEKPLVKLPTTRQTSLRSKDKTALEIVTQKLEELVKKEPVTSSPSSNPKLNVLDIHTTSSSSSRTSSNNEKEIEHLENQFQGLEVKRLHQPTPTNLTKNWYSRPAPPDLQFEERNVSNQFSISSGKLYEWNIDGLSKKKKKS